MLNQLSFFTCLHLYFSKMTICSNSNQFYSFLQCTYIVFFWNVKISTTAKFYSKEHKQASFCTILLPFLPFSQHEPNTRRLLFIHPYCKANIIWLQNKPDNLLLSHVKKGRLQCKKLSIFHSRKKYKKWLMFVLYNTYCKWNNSNQN